VTAPSRREDARDLQRDFVQLPFIYQMFIVGSRETWCLRARVHKGDQVMATKKKKTKKD